MVRRAKGEPRVRRREAIVSEEDGLRISGDLDVRLFVCGGEKVGGREVEVVVVIWSLLFGCDAAGCPCNLRGCGTASWEG